MNDWHRWGVRDLADAFRRREARSRDVTRALLDRIQVLDHRLNSFIAVTAELALSQADEADVHFANGRDLGPLQGIPYAVKDIFDVAGLPTSCNSHVMKGHVAAEDSHVVELLNAQSAVHVGKLATHEFALGGPSFELPYPPARNPWNIDYFTGASSTGSGSAVAAGFVPLAFGSDTSGSIRGPASHCGVVGFKPTYGVVSRRGIYPLSYSLDHCGPLGRTVEDCSIAMSAIAGFDRRDPASVCCPIAFAQGAVAPLRDMRIARVRNFMAPAQDVSDEVQAFIMAAIEAIKRQGASVVDVDLPDIDLFNACGRVIMMAEAFAIHEATITRDPSLYGRYTYHRIMPAAFLSATDYIQAQRVRRELSAGVEAVLRRFDAVVCPGALFPVPRLDAFPKDWPPPARLTATQTIVSNVVGCPAISIPVGLCASGLPLGMQLLGSAHSDPRLLQAAEAVQDALASAKLWPSSKALLDREEWVTGQYRREGGRHSD